jgi:acetyltransferase-like isoleucine patch superfamily enzyme
MNSMQSDMMKDINLMGENVKPLLKHCGIGVKIRPLAKIADPHMVEIDDYAIIDDFVLIAGGKGVSLGKFVHISSFCSIVGGGILKMEDFSGLSACCRIITGSDDFSGRSMTNPCVPKKYKPYLYDGIVNIGRHVILGTNTIVHPNVSIGNYAATGSNTLVLKNLEQNGLYVGSPARRIATRQVNDIQKLEKQLLKDFYDDGK